MPPADLHLGSDTRITSISSEDTQQLKPSCARSQPWSDRVSRLRDPQQLPRQQRPRSVMSQLAGVHPLAPPSGDLPEKKLQGFRKFSVYGRVFGSFLSQS